MKVKVKVAHSFPTLCDPVTVACQAPCPAPSRKILLEWSQFPSPGIFPTCDWTSMFPALQVILYHLSHQGRHCSLLKVRQLIYFFATEPCLGMLNILWIPISFSSLMISTYFNLHIGYLILAINTLVHWWFLYSSYTNISEHDVLYPCVHVFMYVFSLSSFTSCHFSESGQKNTQKTFLLLTHLSLCFSSNYCLSYFLGSWPDIHFCI